MADIIHGCAADNRFGFEEVIWLLITVHNQETIGRFYRYYQFL
ncbi:MAG: hypothetical protein ACLSCV_01150 [Acutalibacteraceae bacterium]